MQNSVEVLEKEVYNKKESYQSRWKKELKERQGCGSMSGLEKKEKEIGLVDLNRQEPEREKKHGTASGRTVERQKNTIRTTVVVVAGCSLLLLSAGIKLCEMSLPVVCAVIIIEGILAAALNDSKLWLHIGIMAAEVVMGFVFGHALFLSLAAVYYFVVLIALKLLGLER